MNTIANIGKRCLSLSLALLILFSPGIPYGANYTWTQTDWSGGVDTSITPPSDTGVAQHPGDQTGWTKYYGQDPNVDSSAAGRISLSPFVSSWTQTTDADFTTGSRNNIRIVGTGVDAALTLNDYSLVLGDGADGDLIVDGTTIVLDGTKNYNSVTLRNGGIVTTGAAASLASPGNVRIATTSVPAGSGLTGDFYYIVTAVDRFGFETPRSPLSDTPTQGQNKISNSFTNLTPKVTWDAVTGGSGYRVYRKKATTTYSTDPYASPSLVCSISDPAITFCQDQLTTPLPGAPHLKTPPTPSATPSSTGGSLPDGTYYYVLTAIDYGGLETAKGSQ
ncbi:MAG: hypothetical protein HZA19_00750, partial [Nitrospirae bacterium]|nr:hypothetical protein [Nitrospirota bacterium]